MEKRRLFEKVDGLLHGGDYNPDQWLDRPDILKEDIRLMKKAGINSATLGVFAWSALEPVEGEFHFGWLKEIMDNLYENGIYTVLATPSGARPAWLDEAYPEAMRVSAQGVRNRHGVRHNHCMSSPVYREKTAMINRKLAENFGSHPGLILWHVSNEFGGECYCPLCQERFQNYLCRKFEGSIDKLNKAWWTAFWSHTYNNFGQIEPPMSNGEICMQGLRLEWKRFTTWNMIDYMKSEIEVLKELTPEIPVTTNFMELFDGLDYHKMADELDVISWDSYPPFHNDGESPCDTFDKTAFHHAVMRSMKKDRPFMVMECTPSLVNWHTYNKLKRPGIHRMAALQAVACGSDTVQYFQWRKGRGSYEQYHGAVVDHNGREDTRVFREVAETGELLEALKDVAGTTVKAEAAVLFDWDNRWAIHDMAGLSKERKLYEETCCNQYISLMKLGVEADVISPLADFSGYKLIAAPMLYMLKPGVAERLKDFVKNGGQLVATYLMGYVDSDTLCHLGGFPGDGLMEVFGLYSEEIDTLYAADRNAARFMDGSQYEIRDFAEIIKLQDASVQALYTQDFYAGMPAVTGKEFGQGMAYYVAARIEQAGMEQIYRQCMERSGMKGYTLPAGVQHHQRTDGTAVYEFYLNVTEQPIRIECPEGTDLISGQMVNGSLELEGYRAAVLRCRL